MDNPAKIGKETLYVFDRVVHFMLSVFKDRLKGITFEKHEIDFDENFLLSQKNKDYMLKVIQYIHDISLPVSDFEFGKMKLNVEQWYYCMGGKGMYFAYNEACLITPKHAAELLGVSTVSLHKYMKRGLETVDTTLLPADVDDILDKYSDILGSYQAAAQENSSIYASYKRTKVKLDVLFPLK